MGGQIVKAGLVALLSAAPGLAAVTRRQNAVNLWGQCGGIGYQGSKVCVSGAVCTAYNDWYHQCVPGSQTTSTTAAPTVIPTTSTSTSSVQSTSTSAAPSSSPTSTAKYFINFGDSYSQTGFDPLSTKPSPSNPFGNPPLPGWTASGGLNWVGFLTSQYNASTLLTYNFAYGGATTNATLVQPWREDVLSLIDQVQQFTDTIATKPSYAPWTAENALFGIWIGVNDVGNSWWKEEYDQLLSEIMDTYFGQLQVLYDAGARQFVALGVPPIHRTPVMVEETEWAQETEAAAIAKYNAAIASRAATFQAANAGSVIKIVDTGVAFNEALDNPTEYGSPDAKCWNGDGVSCLWFNDYHPGIEINRLVAEEVAEAWDGSFFEGKVCIE
ncbi:hormone-sensitive lipase HSL [Podospora pseudopauciseta]|uniref:Hormone-sensitive lipase HSL n=1 Tax=Podospora pseudopauciseta TaxID=2093780 RepID=A0ABR0HAU5_9PEZI|nr:hormone-sensitive lipase HSL [Podospora pseudopauciseta]